MRSTLAAVFAAGVMFLSGCIPFTAGYIGGKAAVGDKDVRAYLASHDVEEEIARAMLEGEFVEGMTKEEVRVVLSSNMPSSYKKVVPESETPAYTPLRKEEGKEKKKEKEEVWVFKSEDPKWLGRYVFKFRKGELVEYETP